LIPFSQYYFLQRALDERERSEEFRLASYLMAPSSEVENNNHPFCIDSTTGKIFCHCKCSKSLISTLFLDVSENDSKDNGKENSGEKQASSHCGKFVKLFQISWCNYPPAFR